MLQISVMGLQPLGNGKETNLNIQNPCGEGACHCLSLPVSYAQTLLLKTDRLQSLCNY